MPETVQQLCDAIDRHRLLPSRESAAMRSRWFRDGRDEAEDPSAFSRWLVSNRYLTDFAVRVLREGKAEQLVLNQYRIRDRLTSGPMAGAYLATDPLDRPVAVEILSLQKAEDPGKVRSFREAAHKAMKLHHPNVGRVLDVGEAGGLHYLVKEYSEGETLADVLRRRGHLPPLQAARLVALALAGLEALHGHGLYAGDLSPECLQLTPVARRTARQHTVKILHAGVPRRLFDPGALGKTDPEEIPDLKLASLFELRTAEGTPDPRGDLFRLGCAFYECLTGTPPFEPADLPRPRRPAPPVRQRAPEVPEMVAVVVEEMISPDPGDRPAKAGFAAKALRVFLAAEQEPHAVRAEENLAAPVSTVGMPHAKEDPEGDEVPSPTRPHHTEGPEGPEPLAGRGGKGEGEVRSPGWWDTVRPRERDLVFLCIGAVGLAVLVLLVQLIVGK